MSEENKEQNKNFTKRLFSLKETMAYLGIKNERTLTKIIKEYNLPVVEFLSKKMIDKEDIDIFINSQKKILTTA